LEVVLKPYEKLQRYWRDTKAGISTVQLNAESVADLEKRYDIRLPGDFRDYLLQSCPKDGSAYDYEMTWWELDRLKNIPDEYPHAITVPAIAENAAKYLFFADYSIWC
jgi:hypothetical protein